MALPVLSGTARLVRDPEMRYAPTGTAVTKLGLAFNAQRKDPSGKWVNGDVFFVNGTVFNQLAEHIADSLSKGDEVVVVGRMKTRAWNDKTTGEKRSAVELVIDGIGPSLKFATAKVVKAARGDGQTSAGAGAGADVRRGDPPPEWDQPPF